MNDKPFKKYGQQMKHLREVKGISCNGSKDKTILIRCGYFNLINGYKMPFVIGKDLNGSHKYIGGTSINHIYAVKQFDDELRHILLKNLTKVEEELRTIVAHKFDFDNHSGRIDWFNIEAYDSNADNQEKMQVITNSYNDINRNKKEYVKHYLNEHSSIPTWIFAKTINFSTFISFLEICKPSVIDSVCKLYSIYNEHGLPNKKLLISMLHLIRKVRNACAHNERIFCLSWSQSRVTKPFVQFLDNPKVYIRHRDQKIVDLIVSMRYFMNNSEYKKMLDEINDIFGELKGLINNNVFDKIRADTGIKNLSILNSLSKTNHIIKYNDFEKM